MWLSSFPNTIYSPLHCEFSAEKSLLRTVFGANGSWRQSRRMWNSPPSTNTLKIHLYVEQFSWKANRNWQITAQSKLQERSPCNEVGWNKGMRCPKRILKGREGPRGSVLALGSRQVEPVWITQSWGPVLRRQQSLAAGRTAGTDRRAREA